MDLKVFGHGSYVEQEATNRNEYCLPDHTHAGVTAGNVYIILEHYYDTESFICKHYYLIENDEGNEVIVEASAFELPHEL